MHFYLKFACCRCLCRRLILAHALHACRHHQVPVRPDQSRPLYLTSDASRLLPRSSRQGTEHACQPCCSQSPLLTTTPVCAQNSLAYAAALGMTNDLHLHGSQYSWLSSIFYIGYLLLQFPTTYILTRLPIGKYLGVSLVMWGACLPLMAACSNFAAAAAVRFAMGMLEAGLLPTCIILTATWYTREEQPLRTALWFGPFSGIFGGVLAYFVDCAQSTLPAWKLLFIVYGASTIVLGVLCLIALPDRHENAWFLRTSEVQQAKMRAQENNTGVSIRQPWNFSHIIEATKDPKYWLVVIFAIAQSVTNAGITNFSPLIISGFGYSRGYTLLLAAPQGGIALVVQVAASIATLHMSNSRCLLWVLSCAPAFVGVAIIRLVQVSKHRVVALMGLYLTGFYNTSWVMAMSLVSSNTAGATKKSFTAVSLAICYAIGNIVGPHFFLDSQKPYYQLGIGAMMVAFVTMAICGGLYRFVVVSPLFGFRSHANLDQARLYTSE
jgi:MFS family permease